MGALDSSHAPTTLSAITGRRRTARVILDTTNGRGGVRRRLPRTVVRFAAIGVVNTLIDLVLFWLLHPPLGIVAANFLSTSAGVTFSFLANGRHTFGASRPTARQAILFLATNGLTMWVLQPCSSTRRTTWRRRRRWSARSSRSRGASW